VWDSKGGTLVASQASILGLTQGTTLGLRHGLTISLGIKAVLV
jgi:hypothetical protein